MSEASYGPTIEDFAQMSFREKITLTLILFKANWKAMLGLIVSTTVFFVALYLLVSPQIEVVMVDKTPQLQVPDTRDLAFMLLWLFGFYFSTIGLLGYALHCLDSDDSTDAITVFFRPWHRFWPAAPQLLIWLVISIMVKGVLMQISGSLPFFGFFIELIANLVLFLLLECVCLYIAGDRRATLPEILSEPPKIVMAHLESWLTTGGLLLALYLLTAFALVLSLSPLIKGGLPSMAMVLIVTAATFLLQGFRCFLSAVTYRQGRAAHMLKNREPGI